MNFSVDQHQGFLQQVYSMVHPDMTVVDLGAGTGRMSRRMAELGAEVIAVDLQSQNEPIDGVIQVVAEAREYIYQLTKRQHFDLALLRNIIQFLPFTEVVEDLLPRIAQHLTPDGSIAIATFYRSPEPPFDRPFASLYTLNDLRHALPGWIEVYADEHRQLGPDMKGKERLFFYTELIVRRPG